MNNRHQIVPLLQVKDKLPSDSLSYYELVATRRFEPLCRFPLPQRYITLRVLLQIALPIWELTNLIQRSFLGETITTKMVVGTIPGQYAKGRYVGEAIPLPDFKQENRRLFAWL